MSYTRSQVILDSNSSGTGTAYFTGDARIITFSVQTSTGSASRFTVSGSNADGFQAAIPETSWSVLTAVTARGLYTLDPGARWIRAEQPDIALSSASSAVITVHQMLQQ